ncbi:MAG: hypothetical protein NT154_14890, partial [Verrucomicrobia bacterium]|nr:hypothetical protein [Verrucomicrobiota bacterium]
MRTLLHFLVLALCWGGPSAFAETLVLKSGSTIDGTIIGTNESHYVLLTDFAVYSFAKTSLREIKQQVTPITETKRSGRLPDFRSTVLALIKQSWGANVKQIPATVIDKGVLRNVPYVSLRCSDDYEVNIYGDVNDPAGIEAGVYRTLLNDGKAKMNCLEFLANLLSEPPDKDIVLSLNRAKDVKEREGFKFEVTSSDAEDAYGGWWVSVYSEKKLNRSRASETEMTQITVSKTTPVEDGSSWTANEMKLARTPLPLIITVSSSDGQLVTNAEVV